MWQGDNNVRFVLVTRCHASDPIAHQPSNRVLAHSIGHSLSMWDLYIVRSVPNAKYQVVMGKNANVQPLLLLWIIFTVSITRPKILHQQNIML